METMRAVHTCKSPIKCIQVPSIWLLQVPHEKHTGPSIWLLSIANYARKVFEQMIKKNQSNKTEYNTGFFFETRTMLVLVF
jgi:hypothetical protein